LDRDLEEEKGGRVFRGSFLRRGEKMEKGETPNYFQRRRKRRHDVSPDRRRKKLQKEGGGGWRILLVEEEKKGKGKCGPHLVLEKKKRMKKEQKLSIWRGGRKGSNSINQKERSVGKGTS